MQSWQFCRNICYWHQTGTYWSIPNRLPPEVGPLLPIPGKPRINFPLSFTVGNRLSNWFVCAFGVFHRTLTTIYRRYSTFWSRSDVVPTLSQVTGTEYWLGKPVEIVKRVSDRGFNLVSEGLKILKNNQLVFELY